MNIKGIFDPLGLQADAPGQTQGQDPLDIQSMKAGIIDIAASLDGKSFGLPKAPTPPGLKR